MEINAGKTESNEILSLLQPRCAWPTGFQEVPHPSKQEAGVVIVASESMPSRGQSGWQFFLRILYYLGLALSLLVLCVVVVLPVLVAGHLLLWIERRTRCETETKGDQFRWQGVR